MSAILDFSTIERAQRQLGMFVLALAVLVFAYSDTLLGMIDIWSRSETFAHGFAIYPIALYLLWRRRHHLAAAPLAVDWRALVLVPLVGLAWLLAEVVDVAVVKQLTFTAMIPLLVWFMFGWQLLKTASFPLFFLIFAVPMGEGLITPLMNFTAVFTVTLIEWTGIPIYVEGTHFSLPTGDWSVVEGCSGIRYLIASVTMGTLYAYLSYSSLTRRLVFIGFAIVLPIIANGLRAYMIVMIAHFSGMKLALGVDHYIYGWVFFGFIMLLMFWIGSYWRQDESAPPTTGATARSLAARDRPPGYAAFLAAVGLIGIWPYLAHSVAGNAGEERPAIALALPDSLGQWQASSGFTDWRPRYQGMDAQTARFYRQGDRRVGVYLAYYARPRQDAELINSQNIMIEQKHPIWQQIGATPKSLAIEPGSVIQTRLRSARQRLLIHDWYWIGGFQTTNDYLGKLVEAYHRLSGNGSPSVGVVVFTPYSGTDPGGAAERLTDFIDSALPGIEASIRRSGRGGDGQG